MFVTMFMQICRYRNASFQRLRKFCLRGKRIINAHNYCSRFMGKHTRYPIVSINRSNYKTTTVNILNGRKRRITRCCRWIIITNWYRRAIKAFYYIVMCFRHNRTAFIPKAALFNVALSHYIETNISCKCITCKLRLLLKYGFHLGIYKIQYVSFITKHYLSPSQSLESRALLDT
ncbi:Uncharacterised protein [Chlamydia trachomatis]|nr:Uncharacterised protein [Chlamydia trachomatis]